MPPSHSHFGHGDHALGDGEPGQARDAVNVKFAHEALAMGFHSAGADVEAAGNFLVAETFGNVGEDFPLARGQVAGIGFRARCPGPSG